jgi:hypothetical protein
MGERDDVVPGIHSLDGVPTKFVAIPLSLFSSHFAAPFPQSVHIWCLVPILIDWRPASFLIDLGLRRTLIRQVVPYPNLYFVKVRIRCQPAIRVGDTRN